MQNKTYLSGFYPYLINCCEDGYYLTDGNGFMLESEEMLDIGKNLIKFAKKHNKDILEYNNKIRINFEKQINSFKNSVKQKPNGYIYIMECAGKYKIGLSKNVERRKKQLNNRPFPVNIVYKSKLIEDVYLIEDEILDCFRDKKIDGEWFNLDEKDIKIIIDYLEVK